MRLIDADRLKQALKESFSDEGDGAVEAGAYWHHKFVMKVIDSSPTAEAAPMQDYMDLHNHFVDWTPVRHGRWEVAGNTTHYYTCSVCGNPGDGFDNYCRSCGAKMERPCDKCQEWDCYGCDYKHTERSE